MTETINKALFITVDGIEGVGKSSCLDLISETLQSADIDFMVTREPGGTQLGEEIRELLLAHRHDDMHSDTELLLMFAARAQHIHQVIKPALAAGRWVVCDRFTDATYAYQGGGRGIDAMRIEVQEKWVQGDFQPDVTLILDASVETGLARAGKRSAADRFEVEQAAFFERTRQCYLDRAGKLPQRYHIVDAEAAMVDVHTNIKNIIADLIKASVSIKAPVSIQEPTKYD